jgi:hypothetical protein
VEEKEVEGEEEEAEAEEEEEEAEEGEEEGVGEGADLPGLEFSLASDLEGLAAAGTYGFDGKQSRVFRSLEEFVCILENPDPEGIPGPLRRPAREATEDRQFDLGRFHSDEAEGEEVGTSPLRPLGCVYCLGTVAPAGHVGGVPPPPSCLSACGTWVFCEQDAVFQEATAFVGHWEEQLSRYLGAVASGAPRGHAVTTSFGDWSPDEQATMQAIPSRVRF